MTTNQRVETHGETPRCELCKHQLRWDDVVAEFVDEIDSVACGFFDYEDDHQPTVP